MLAGFTGGLIYSRTKADPVRSALFDARRIVRAGAAHAGAAVRTVARAVGKMSRRAWR
jgi:hypothetical protein